MVDWGTILTGIAACITAISGGVVGIMAVRRSSPRERRAAARGVIEKALNTDAGDEDDERRAAFEEFYEEFKRRGERP